MKALAFAVVASAISVGVAFAETPAATTAQPSTVTKVENWTTDQWNAAKTEWAKDKTKWADCNQQSVDRTGIGWTMLGVDEVATQEDH